MQASSGSNFRGKSNLKLYALLVENSVTVPSEATERLCEAARDAGVAVTIGINERNAAGPLCDDCVGHGDLCRAHVGPW